MRDIILVGILILGLVAIIVFVPVGEEDVVTNPEVDNESGTTTEQIAEFALSVGEEETGQGLTIRLQEVVQDSRCPVDAECIEGGAITTAVSLATSTESTSVNIASDDVPYMFGEYSISIINVLPPLQSGMEIEQNEYEVAFRVTKEEQISWDRAIEILNSGDVLRVFQTHSLEVELVLENGQIIQTTEPEIDAIFREIEECGTPCENIQIGTE